MTPAKQRLVDLKYEKLKSIKVDKTKIGQKYKLTTANGLTKAICDFLNLSGHQAERINTMGVWMKDRGNLNGGFYRPGTSTRGSADISATIKRSDGVGLSVKIEVKIGTDRLSEFQKAYRDKIISAGGVYEVFSDFDQFMGWYDNFITT